MNRKADAQNDSNLSSTKENDDDHKVLNPLCPLELAEAMCRLLKRSLMTCVQSYLSSISEIDSLSLITSLEISNETQLPS
jgi:hypothetical protein